ncbi:MAG: Chromosomal replication initiator protein DnaA [Syntrophaceae bacterium PtaU1.Bin231]|nr:MAG: Chromosomal replication initiator protein DnaA [Syntrophaceae bacterium PtaU1.Bin231]
MIRGKVSQQNFETWIRPIRLIAVDGENVSLAVPNRFFKDWLMENYLPLLQEALSSAVGQSVNIQFVIGQTRERAVVSVRRQDVKNGAVPEKAGKPAIHPSLNPQYSFERFVIGACNQFAHAASMAVAEQPAKNYNPLFIYGGVGLGKTHLLNAIGLHTLSIYPEANVVYVSAEEFMNELINSIRYDRMQKFREKYRNIDSLLIDDIQFIAGKERTQEEFFHTFNTLHDSGKQIVVTSDKFPKDIPNLESRLRSRFEWGLIADIQPPEIETKIAIIEKKSQEIHIDLSNSVAHYIASQAESNIRELEGYLIRISAYSSLTNRPIDMELVREVLKKILKQNEKQEVTIDQILKAVSAKFNLKLADIKSQKKNKNFVLPRQIAMYLSRKLTTASFPDIGEKVGGRDHSTVIYANNKIAKAVETNQQIKKTVQEIENDLLHRS